MEPNIFTRVFQFNRRQYKDRGHWRRFNQQHYIANIIRRFQCTRLHASKHQFIVWMWTGVDPKTLFQETVNSAVLGAAYQAKYGLERNKDSNVSFQSVVSTVAPSKLACLPHKDAHEVWSRKSTKFAQNIFQCTIWL